MVNDLAYYFKELRSLRPDRSIADHFVDVNKTITMPKGAEKEVPDNRPPGDF